MTNTGAPWICPTGTTQSPIDIYAGSNTGGPPFLAALSSLIITLVERSPPSPAGQKAPASLRTQFSYGPLVSNGTNLQILNNGHTIQVPLESRKMHTSHPASPLPCVNLL